jgi:hypothetical protein
MARPTDRLDSGAAVRSIASDRRSLVPKLQLGNTGVSEAPASAATTKQSFADKCVPKLELGNEETDDAHYGVCTGRAAQRRGYKRLITRRGRSSS